MAADAMLYFKKIGLTYVLSCITNERTACYTYKTLLQLFKTLLQLQNHCNYYEAAFGCLTSILNGKCWKNAFRAFRMLVEALLHDFLSDGEKSYNDIVVYLERARSHPTGKMWVETTIYPTFLAMELVRAERETDWLLQQDCLWRMLPLLFAAGQHWYARDHRISTRDAESPCSS